MASFSGINASIYINDTNVLSGMAEFNLDVAMSPVEDTYFSREWDTYVPSVRGVTGSFSGNIVDSTAKGLIDNALLNGTAITLSIYETQANYWYLTSAYITSFSPSVDVKGKGTITYNFTGSGAMSYNTRWASLTGTIAGSGLYLSPTYGSELLTNGGFASDTAWTKGTGWTISAGLASKAVGSSGNITQAIGVADKWYVAELVVNSVIASGFRSFIGGGVSGILRTTAGTYIDTLRRGTTTALGISASASAEGSIDNQSIKEITISTAMRLLTYQGSVSFVGLVLPNTVAGTQTGVVVKADSSSNPQNFIIAYHDGNTTIKMDKCVGGTWTNLVSDTATNYGTNSFIEIREVSTNTYALYFNGTQVGSNQSVADAGITSNTLYGIFSTHSSSLLGGFYLNNIIVPY